MRLGITNVVATGLLVLGGLGCPRGSTTPPEGEAVDTRSCDDLDDGDTGEAEDDPTALEPCEPPGATFEDHAWAPDRTPALASLRLNDPALPQALVTLGVHARDRGHGLPIPLAFSLGQWSWQVPALQATLAQAGFHPGELVFVAGEQSDHAWVWRSACDLEVAIERVEAAWPVKARRVVEGVVASPLPSTDDGPGFPYEVLMLGGERMALVPAGTASGLLQRWSRPGSQAGLGAAARTPGELLDALPPAAITLVSSGDALVNPGAASPQSLRALRVTADAVVDASLPAP